MTIKKAFFLLIFLFPATASFSQSPWFIKGGYSFLNDASKLHFLNLDNADYRIRSNFPLGINVGLGFNFSSKISVSTGIELNFQTYTTSEYIDSTTPPIFAGTSSYYGYDGPVVVDHRHLFYTFPLYFDFRILQIDKFQLRLNTGYQAIFHLGYDKGKPDVYGDHGTKKEYLGMKNCLSLGLEMRYKIKERINVFCSWEIRNHIFYELILYNANLGLVYDFK